MIANNFNFDQATKNVEPDLDSLRIYLDDSFISVAFFRENIGQLKYMYNYPADKTLTEAAASRNIRLISGNFYM